MLSVILEGMVIDPPQQGQDDEGRPRLLLRVWVESGERTGEGATVEVRASDPRSIEQLASVSCGDRVGIAGRLHLAFRRDLKRIDPVPWATVHQVLSVCRAEGQAA
jgi:hypothetical protein